MRTYSFTAVEAGGRSVRDQILAVDLQEALRRIHDRGLFPVQVREDRPPAQASARAERRRARRGGRVRASVLVSFTRQLATLVQAGLPLLRGLRLLEEQEAQGPMRSVVRGVADAIEGGSTLTETLAQYPRVFNPMFVSMVKAGEAGGVLDVILLRLAEFQERSQRIKGKVTAAMFYPAAVLAVAVVILGVLMVVVVPRFGAIFTDLLGPGQRLPPFTLLVLGVGRAVASHFLVVLAGVLGAAGLLTLAIRTRRGRAWFDRVRLRLPAVGPVLRKAAVARFTRTLGTLLQSGVPILQALTIVRDTTGNQVVAAAVDRVHQGVKDGDALALPMAATRVFPATVIGMVDVGEQTGALPDMLGRVADVYDNEVDHAVTAATSLLEPLLIVFLALVVGSIVIALFLPLIEVINGLSGPVGNDLPGGA